MNLPQTKKPKKYNNSYKSIKIIRRWIVIIDLEYQINRENRCKVNNKPSK